MANICSHCAKRFTCGCQKTQDKNGNVVHKTCKSAADKK